MGGQLLAVLDAEQPACQTGIQKIEFGCLDQALVEILVMRWQQVHDITDFQYGDPGLGRVMRNATVIGQRGKVEELPASACTQFQEALKGAQIPYIDQLADVSFQVSPYIVSVPGMWFEPAIVDGGVGAIEERLVQVSANFSCTLQLIVGHG